jgi:nicotinamide mononucleotide transporter
MLQTAFTLLSTDVTWLEVIAFVLALACVACNVAAVHWGWPLAVVSSVLYGWLFASSRLYGEAALQGVFVVLSLWGWWQWLFARRPPSAAQGAAPAGLRITRLGRRAGLAVIGWLVLWPVFGLILAVASDSDVPAADGFTTAGSVVGQVLLGRKLIENWHVWIVVNLASVALFEYKHLRLTAILYAVFAVLAVVGLRRWRRDLGVGLAHDPHALRPVR